MCIITILVPTRCMQHGLFSSDMFHQGLQNHYITLDNNKFILSFFHKDSWLSFHNFIIHTFIIHIFIIHIHGINVVKFGKGHSKILPEGQSY